MGNITKNLLNKLKSTKDIRTFHKENVALMSHLEFTEYLNMLLAKNELKKTNIIKISNIEKSYVYQIFDGEKKNPSKNKILAIAFAMNLSLEEINRLLTLLGISQLYSRDPRDSIIIFANLQKMNTIECNEMLYNEGFDILK